MSNSITERELAFNARVGGWLKQLRLNKKLTQVEISESIGIHRNTLARYESGAPMPLYIFLRLSAKVGVPAAEVLKW